MRPPTVHFYSGKFRYRYLRYYESEIYSKVTNYKILRRYATLEKQPASIGPISQGCVTFHASGS